MNTLKISLYALQTDSFDGKLPVDASRFFIVLEQQQQQQDESIVLVSPQTFSDASTSISAKMCPAPPLALGATHIILYVEK